MHHGYRQLAVTVLQNGVETLKRKRPRRAAELRVWTNQRERETAFFRNPRRSAFWIEAAGLEWNTVVSRLAAQGLLAASLLLLTGCDATYTVRSVCRGDSTPAVADTSLVRCATLDTLAVGR